MIRLHFVVDGPRDYPAVEYLTKTILACEIRGSSVQWMHLREGRTRGLAGFARKLWFAILDAKDLGACGVVGVVDNDGANPPKLRNLKRGRDDVRSQKRDPFPIAIGEALPEFEAWILDDPVAVREALRLDPDVGIPTVEEKPGPKKTLDSLIASSPLKGRPVEVIPKIAEKVEAARFQHRKKTGFDAFERDVRAELGGLVAR